MGKLDLGKLRGRFAARKAADESAGFQKFLRIEKDKGRYRVRPRLFWPNGPTGDPELEREFGMHFGLESLGATMRYRKDNQIKTKTIKATKCRGLTLAQYEVPALRDLYQRLREDYSYRCSPEDLELLDAHCPICAEAERAHNEGDAAGKEMWKALRARRKFLYNVVRRTDENQRGVYAVLEIGQAHSMALSEIIFSSDYAGLVFGDVAREFALWVEGDGFDRNKVQVLPEDTPLGNPVGSVVNLLDPAWAAENLECWSVEDVQRILAGETVTAPDRAAAAAKAGPKPMCFNKGIKNATQPQCAQCAFLSECDIEKAAAPPATEPAAAPTTPAPAATPEPAKAPEKAKGKTSAAADMLAKARALAEKGTK